jgi:hypothetical protein
MAARTRDGADAAGVIAGAPQLVGVANGLAEGLLDAAGDGLVEGLAEGLGDGVVALGPAPQAIEASSAKAARELNRMDNAVDYARMPAFA